MRRLAAAVMTMALCGAACSGEAITSGARFDVADTSEPVTALQDRVPVPAGALPAFVVRSYADPAAFDELLAEAEAQARDDQLIITVDLRGCMLLTLWAVPEPDTIRVGYEFDPDIDCVAATDYRALFIVDQRGTSARGDWAYTTPPAISLKNQTSE